MHRINVYSNKYSQMSNHYDNISGFNLCNTLKSLIQIQKRTIQIFPRTLLGTICIVVSDSYPQQQ